MAHALFGVPDSEYGEQMAEKIANINQNEDYLHLLLENQTSVINSTISVLKQDKNDMKLHFSELKKSIYNDSNTVQDENLNIRHAQKLMSLAIQLNTLAADLQRIETELIAALTQSHGQFAGIEVKVADALNLDFNGLRWCCIKCRNISVEFYNFSKEISAEIREINRDIWKSHLVRSVKRLLRSVQLMLTLQSVY